MELAYILNTITQYDNVCISEEYPVQYQNILSISSEATIRDVYNNVLRDIIDNRVCDDLRGRYEFKIYAKNHPIDYEDDGAPIL